MLRTPAPRSRTLGVCLALAALVAGCDDFGPNLS